MLKANGVVPTTTSSKRPASAQPAPEEVKPDIIDIEDDDLKEIRTLEVSFFLSFGAHILSNVLISQSRLLALKSRRMPSNGNPSKKVKREPLKPVSFVPGEVIDLT